MIEDLKAYESYKSPGLRWAERIPSHWEVDRAGSSLQKLNMRSRDGREELLTVSSERGVVPRRTATVTMFKAKSYAGYKLCWPDDLVINSLWAWAGGLGVSRHHGIVSSAYGVYRSRLSSKLLPGYLHELVRSVPFNWELQVRSKGIWISRLQLSDDAILAAPVLIPPPDEQAAIVRFLDHAKRRIDQFIRSKKKLIALLNEQKQATIFRAVTLGIDPRATLRDSGIPWIGRIPAHWELRRAKQVCLAIIDCKNRTPDRVDGGEYTVVRTTNIRNGEFSIRGSYPTDRRHFLEWTQRGAPRQGDVFFTREAPAGEACLVPDLPKLCMGQRMMYFRPKPEVIDPKFLIFNIYGPIGRAYIEHACNGSTVGHLRLGQVSAFPLLLCPLTEQSAIVRHIEEATHPQMLAIRQADKEVALAREYRTRLVSDVVTGQLDVRAAASVLPDLEVQVSPITPPDDDDADLDDSEAA